MSGDEGEPVTQPREAQRESSFWRFSSPDAPLEILQAENVLFNRLNRRLQKILEDLGGRALVELAIRGAELRLGIAGLDDLAADWIARGNSAWMIKVGGDRYIPVFRLHVRGTQ